MYSYFSNKTRASCQFNYNTLHGNSSSRCRFFVHRALNYSVLSLNVFWFTFRWCIPLKRLLTLTFIWNHSTCKTYNTIANSEDNVYLWFNSVHLELKICLSLDTWHLCVFNILTLTSFYSFPIFLNGFLAVFLFVRRWRKRRVQKPDLWQKSYLFI